MTSHCIMRFTEDCVVACSNSHYLKSTDEMIALIALKVYHFQCQWNYYMFGKETFSF